jgi:hypothetical protein
MEKNDARIHSTRNAADRRAATRREEEQLDWCSPTPTQIDWCSQAEAREIEARIRQAPTGN